MAEFLIRDEDLTPLKDKVIVVTGGSSGIGLETVKLLLSLGAAGVVSGDVQAPPADTTVAALGSSSNDDGDGDNNNSAPSSSSRGGGSSKPLSEFPGFTHRHTDVTRWADLVALFREAADRHGRVDHAFVCAGISPKARYLSLDLDAEGGEPLEPSRAAFDVNLRGAVNACTLAIHHLRRNPAGGGSVVAAASVTSVMRFAAADYAASKHGLLGFVRGMHDLLEHRGLSPGRVRINAIAPSWTETAINPNEDLRALLQMVGGGGGASAEAEAPLFSFLQPASAPARSAALLMADARRAGQLVLSAGGVFREIDEAALLPAYAAVAGPRAEDEGVTFRRLIALNDERAARAGVLRERG